MFSRVKYICQFLVMFPVCVLLLWFLRPLEGPWRHHFVFFTFRWDLFFLGCCWLPDDCLQTGGQGKWFYWLAPALSLNGGFAILPVRRRFLSTPKSRVLSNTNMLNVPVTWCREVINNRLIYFHSRSGQSLDIRPAVVVTVGSTICEFIQLRPTTTENK